MPNNHSLWTENENIGGDYKAFPSAQDLDQSGAFQNMGELVFTPTYADSAIIVSIKWKDRQLEKPLINRGFAKLPFILIQDQQFETNAPRVSIYPLIHHTSKTNTIPQSSLVVPPLFYFTHSFGGKGKSLFKV